MSASPQTRIAPGPSGHWLLGSLPERRKDPLRLFLDGMNTYGDVVRYRMGPVRVHAVCGPEAAKHVLVDEARRYEKGWIIDPLRTLVGNGLLTSEGDFWMRQRRLAQPAFHRERLAQLSLQMVRATEAMLARWDALDGQVVEISAEMMRLTLAIVTRTLFSADVTEEAGAVKDALDAASVLVNQRALTPVPLPLWVPSRSNRALVKARAELDRVVFRMIDERRGGGGPKDDLLAMLMEAQDADTGERMTDAQLRDEVMTLFLAGHETTANALSWLCQLLARHPDVAARLREEARAVLGSGPAGVEQLPKLTYARRVLEETMRLYPPAWLVARVAAEDDEVGGFHIRKGSPVMVLLYALHRNPRCWEDPDRFDPERFTPERVAQRHKYAYLPFGAGQRMCIGNQFALMEGQLAVAMMASRFALEETPEDRCEPQPHITLRAHDLRLRLRRL